MFSVIIGHLGFPIEGGCVIDLLFVSRSTCLCTLGSTCFMCLDVDLLCTLVPSSILELFTCNLRDVMSCYLTSCDCQC